MKISLDDEDFYKRLTDLCPQRRHLAPINVNLNLLRRSGKLVLLAYNAPSPFTQPPTPDDHTKFLQKSHIDGVFYNYYEEWHYEAVSNINVLDRIYLHLYVIENDNQWPLYSIHIDADMDDQSENYTLKAVPHLHVETAPYPFNHYHHNFSKIDIYSSIEAIDDAFENILERIIHEMIKTELKDEFWKVNLNLRLEVLSKYRDFYDTYYSISRSS